MPHVLHGRGWDFECFRILARWERISSYILHGFRPGRSPVNAYRLEQVHDYLKIARVPWFRPWNRSKWPEVEKSTLLHPASLMFTFEKCHLLQKTHLELGYRSVSKMLEIASVELFFQQLKGSLFKLGFRLKRRFVFRFRQAHFSQNFVGDESK